MLPCPNHREFCFFIIWGLVLHLEQLSLDTNTRLRLLAILLQNQTIQTIFENLIILNLYHKLKSFFMWATVQQIHEHLFCALMLWHRSTVLFSKVKQLQHQFSYQRCIALIWQLTIFPFRSFQHPSFMEHTWTINTKVIFYSRHQENA